MVFVRKKIPQYKIVWEKKPDTHSAVESEDCILLDTLYAKNHEWQKKTLNKYLSNEYKIHLLNFF